MGRFINFYLSLRHFVPAWLILAALCCGVLRQNPVSAQETSIRLSDKNPPQTIPWRTTRLMHLKYNRIFAVDPSPLENRIPVILIPGRAEEFQFGVWWHQYRELFALEPALKKDFKLYVYLYNSRHSVHTLSDHFATAYRNHFSNLPSRRPVVLVGYSLGGIIAQHTMENAPDIDAHVAKVIAIAVPFHGSPLFSSNWFARDVKNHSPSLIRTAWDRWLYRLYMLDKPNLRDSLAWDNFDDSEPLVQRKNSKNTLVAYQPPRVAHFKKKLLVYASYLENNWATPNARPEKSILKTLPTVAQKAVGLVFPGYLTSATSALAFANLKLANIRSNCPERDSGCNLHLFRYNDGAVPLSSALYLPPRSVPYHEDLPELLGAVDVPAVRLFGNFGHLDFSKQFAGFRRLHVSDELHPEEGKRNPIQWVFYDLEKSLPELRRGPNPARQQWARIKPDTPADTVASTPQTRL